ncbi:MAG TPA: hypothetical protein VJ508_13815, partial [Saprospiraceae bacterium]|nr:hypothetical protein [Saprospiraceae bacterium]
IQIFPINCNGGTGGINLNNLVFSSGFVTINWDNLGTMGDDDYGSPPADDDPYFISGLSAGSYELIITITDDPMFPTYECMYYDTVVLTEPTVLNVSLSNTPIACNGGNTTVTATPSGGTPGYTYLWSTSATTSSVTGPANTYTVTVTDSKGCTKTATVTVSQPTAITASAVGSTVACAGTGTIDLTVSGGTPNYNYDWSYNGVGGGDPQDPTGLNAGTYTVTVTDANGCTKTASATVTVLPPTFTIPPNGSSTVPCIINAQVVPTPPPVTDNCGNPLTVVLTSTGPDPVCFGDKVYTFTYTDPVSGATATWTYTYTVSPPTFTLPANGSSTVACVANATQPTPPSVTNSCNSAIIPTGPVISANPACGGTKTYTWTYTDCTNVSAQWVYTYTISPPTLVVPAAGGSTVACISNAQVVPTPPPQNNSCGQAETISGPVVGADPVCSGTKTYTFTYTDCTGNSAPWVYTYTISPPTFSVPAGGSSTVPCISNAQVVPTPPTVMNSCNTTITPTGPVVGPDPACSGTKTYTWTYTDCTGTSAQWVYTYNISAPTLTAPAPGSATVACISNAQTVPTPPVVMNSCGTTISPTGPVIGPD